MKRDKSMVERRGNEMSSPEAEQKASGTNYPQGTLRNRGPYKMTRLKSSPFLCSDVSSPTKQIWVHGTPLTNAH